MGIKETADTFHTSRNTVRKYVRLFLSSGKNIEQLLALSDEHLQDMFGLTDNRHREPSSRRIDLEALLPGYVKRLSRKGTSIRGLFKEYHAEYPDGYQLSSFKRAVREYKFHIKVVGHVEHYAADQMYVDFAGDRLEIVDEMTGETKKAEVFVAILPFSHYTYCEAVWSQRKEDLIKGCENAMYYFGGVPAAIVPDNLRAAVTGVTATSRSSMRTLRHLPNITAVPSTLPECGIRKTRHWLKTPSNFSIAPFTLTSRE